MNILIVSSIMPPDIGGPASYVPEIISRLKKEHNFSVITFTKNPVEIPGIPIISVSQEGNSLFRQMRLFSKIRKLSEKSDLIYAQDPLTVGLASVLVGKPAVIKYVGDPAWEKAFGEGKTQKTLHEFLKTPTPITLLTKFTLKLAKKIITPSNHLKSVIIKNYGIDTNKIFVIPNAVSSITNKRNFSIKKTYTAVTIGRLVKWKNVAGIIEAVKNLNIRLVIIGDGPELSNLKEIASKNIIFKGRLSRKETFKELASSDVFILNSLYEGLPHTVLEAFSVGTPVIATDIPGTNEIAINGKTALTVSPNDSKALAQALTKLLSSPKLREELTKNAYQEILNTYNWPTTLKSLRDIFDSTQKY